jgi:O-antigen/teichoic acid export membrane protein
MSVVTSKSDAKREEASHREFGGYFAWVGGGRIASELLRLGSTLLLTRLLTAEMFGLVLIVNRLVQGLTMISDVGINASIVQNKAGSDPKFLNTAWTVQILRGLLLWLVCWLGASAAASFYDEPQLNLLIPVAGIALVVSGFASPALALVQRELKVRSWVGIDIGAQVASVSAMIAVALIWPSVWALIAGAIAAASFRMLVSHVLKMGYRPRPGWDQAAFMALATFGAWIIVNTFVGWLADSAEALAMPRIVPMAVVGVYAVAAQLGNIPYRFLGAVGANAVFPLFSRTTNMGEPLVPVYQMVQRQLLAIGGAAIAGLLATGAPAIELLLDPRWQAGGAMLWPLALSQWFRIMAIPGANAVFALGYPNLLVVGNVMKLVGYALFVPIGVYLGQLSGAVMLGALSGFAVGESMSVIIYRVAMKRLGFEVGWQELEWCLRLAVSIALLAVSRRFLDAHSLHPIAVALIGVAIVTPVWFRPLKQTVMEVIRRRGQT